MADNRTSLGLKSSFLIFGFGYTASFLAKKLTTLHFNVVGTTRDQKRIGYFNGYQLVDFFTDSVNEHLKTATHVLISTPPSEPLGDPVLARFSDSLKEYGPHIQWLGYFSSTGVYGNHNGEWVNELAPSKELSSRAQLRLEAERSWISFANAHLLPLHIFRLAGIYGPRRNALTRLLSDNSQTIYKKDHFFSRIHVEDIVETVVASMKNPNPISIYNVADDEPTPSHVVDEYAASLLKKSSPIKIPFESANLSPMAHEFYMHNRRVDNEKVKRELGIALNYPTYKEGLLKIYTEGCY